MRTLLTVLLALLLPIQWSVAAVAPCARGGLGAAEPRHGSAELAPAGHGAEHGQAGPQAIGARVAPGRASRAHASHEHASHDRVPHDGASRVHVSHVHPAHGPSAGPAQASPSGADVADGEALADTGTGIDCGHPDCGTCCHAGASLPASRLDASLAPRHAGAPGARADAPRAPPALDGPYKPPRVPST